jgi:mRNA interferase MazF
VIRGGVYAVSLGDAKRGHEQRGKRYGIVMSPPDSPLTVATIIPTSTSASAGLVHVPVNFDDRPSLALLEQIRVIDTNYIGEMVGMVPLVQMLEIELALAQYLGLTPTLTGRNQGE